MSDKKLRLGAAPFVWLNILVTFMACSAIAVLYACMNAENYIWLAPVCFTISFGALGFNRVMNGYCFYLLNGFAREAYGYKALFKVVATLTILSLFVGFIFTEHTLREYVGEGEALMTFICNLIFGIVVVFMVENKFVKILALKFEVSFSNDRLAYYKEKLNQRAKEYSELNMGLSKVELSMIKGGLASSSYKDVVTVIRDIEHFIDVYKRYHQTGQATA
tara:strand:- start:181562 stop:182221 length:660 start_codon:yes stop_codon:yes gene_type:complete